MVSGTDNFSILFSQNNLSHSNFFLCSMSLSKLDKERIIRPDYSKCGLLTNVSLRTGGYLPVAEIENHLETSIAI